MTNGFLGATAGRLFDAGRRVVIKLVNILADGDQVFAEWTAQATALSGAASANRCGGVFMVRDGQIVAVREYSTPTTHAGRSMATGASSSDVEVVTTSDSTSTAPAPRSRPSEGSTPDPVGSPA